MDRLTTPCQFPANRRQRCSWRFRSSPLKLLLLLLLPMTAATTEDAAVDVVNTIQATAIAGVLRVWTDPNFAKCSSRLVSMAISTINCQRQRYRRDSGIAAAATRAMVHSSAGEKVMRLFCPFREQVIPATPYCYSILNAADRGTSYYYC